ncbi:hypothetical protein N658DRAFT_507906 [Parathielavia hyrcaniae]|uniref:Uncharacterized protein n=1 Tax=Parathielavia hyrcaniae TaxID=113614 RepID=A0AAN6T0L7_9PEZI|nr:hypothetical protein N658DRAFT_507906 [Parathielavia hyrcaniae]
MDKERISAFLDVVSLLALFGERVTTQFMSQSTGWADNIILAMAPLGVITAIVGAIRVGGPSWLKAIIGRARESRAVVEAELMSSTSNEICELWNGQQIVRVMGKGQFGPQADPVFGVTMLGNPKEQEDPEKALAGVWAQIGQSGPNSERPDKDKDRDLDPHKHPVAVVRNAIADTPNLTLNVYNQLVNDQAFQSFAIFPETAQPLITTSHRAREESLPCKVREAITTVGTLVGICGFVVQFVGLRGMHWSTSAAQLSATVVVTTLRAAVRRKLAKKPKAVPLVRGHELDWLAMTLGKPANAPWQSGSDDYSTWKDYYRPWAGSATDKEHGLSADGDRSDWIIAAVEVPERRERLRPLQQSPGAGSASQPSNLDGRRPMK